MSSRNAQLIALFESIGGLYVGRFMNSAWDDAALNRVPKFASST